MDFLKTQPMVDPGEIAAIGYCFGGGVVLNMARQGIDLKGVASFHGNLAAVKPAQHGAVKAKLLVLHGGDDKFTTAEQVDEFKREMKDAGADFQFITYPGAKHGFTNRMPTHTPRNSIFRLDITQRRTGNHGKNSKSFSA